MARRKPPPRRRPARPKPRAAEPRRPLLGAGAGLVAILWWAQVAVSGPSILRLVLAVGTTLLAVVVLAPLLVQRGLVKLIRARRRRDRRS